MLPCRYISIQNPFYFRSGPFTFTYNRGHGECKNPVSNIDSCTEDSRLLLSFQACPDVSGTESTGMFIDITKTRILDNLNQIFFK